jgi:hypothetical protein
MSQGWFCHAQGHLAGRPERSQPPLQAAAQSRGSPPYPLARSGLGNGLLLGYLMYRSALVPRAIAVLGLIGGPLVFASGIAVQFGLYEQVLVGSFIATLPEMAWEATLGVWLIVKGFNRLQ